MLPKVERSGISFYCLNKGGDIKKKAKACLGLSIGLFVSDDIAVGTKGQTVDDMTIFAKTGQVELSFSLSNCTNRKGI